MPLIFPARETKCSHSRRGAVSIWAIICLVFVTTIGATLGRMALMSSRQMIQERRQSQAEWLAQAGWLLAVSRLETDTKYSGETWEVPATELGGADAGRVRINVVSPADKPHEVTVVAEFPVGAGKVQVTRQGIRP